MLLLIGLPIDLYETIVSNISYRNNTSKSKIYCYNKNITIV